MTVAFALLLGMNVHPAGPDAYPGTPLPDIALIYFVLGFLAAPLLWKLGKAALRNQDSETPVEHPA